MPTSAEKVKTPLSGNQPLFSDQTPAGEQPGTKPFYTVTDLALRWDLSERQVRRFIASGELKSTRFRTAVRVSAAEVATFEAARTGVM
jgi:excisionase family DNA binding protein